MRIIPAPRHNPMSHYNIRQIVNLCRLIRRPDLTYWRTERYKKKSGCAD